MQLSDLGITTAKVNQFAKKGISTAEQLVRFLPRRYMDFSNPTGILPEDEISCVCVKVDSVSANHGSNIPYIQARCTVIPENVPLQVTWFHQNYMYNKIAYMAEDHNTIYCCGKITWNEDYKTYQMCAPQLFEYDSPKQRTIKPVYPKIKDMSADYLATQIGKCVRLDICTQDPYPPQIVRQYSDLSLKEALTYMHFPSSMEDVERARKRLVFDELLDFAAQNEWAKRCASIGSPFPIKTLKLHNDLYRSLPFQLTEDQIGAIKGMVEEIRAGRLLNALVQGDVGCGKTIVAMMMMATMAGNGYQSVLLAPTQVLARQHFEDAKALFEPFNIKVAYLGTDLKQSERKKEIAAIESGVAKIIVGTSSLIGGSRCMSSIAYKELALLVVDEEHKFGVAQREALRNRASGGIHSITMSATPIPRTLAQTVYGSTIKLFPIKSKPNGRMPIVTGLATTKEKLFKFIIKEAKQGHQTYVVCPMIDRNEAAKGIRSVSEVSEEYHAALDQYGIEIETLTGRDSKATCNEVIERFKNGETQVLISTSVVEVGVNVPSATTMMIVNAERFGLASLHQLRGRVGRGSYQSYCVLDASCASEEAKERLNVLVKSNDGFEIAQEDLRLRGSGDFLGTEQSGDNRMLYMMLTYPKEYEKAQSLAATLIDEYGWVPDNEDDDPLANKKTG